MRLALNVLVFAASLGSFACGNDDDASDPGTTSKVTSSSSGGSRSTSSGDAPPSSSGASSSSSSGEPVDPASLAPYPIVFLHGMAGFVTAGSGPLELVYFAGVLEDLAAHGEADVYATTASPYAGSWDRAHQIAPQIDAILQRTGKRKVNLVAHSQGGLDARLLASPHGLGYGDRIASITTVATPHRGTAVADLALGVLGQDNPTFVDPAAEALVQLLGTSLYGLPADQKSSLRAQLLDLSVDHAASVFNPTYVDDPAVHYESYAGRTNLRLGAAACADGLVANPSALDPTSPVLQATATYLEGNPLAPVVNDGLVPVESAHWGTFVGCIAADHMDEIGQPQAGLHTFDQLGFYRALVARVRSLAY